MQNNGIINHITWTLVGLSLAIALFGVALFTELGQLLNLPSNWLYAIHPYLGWASVLLLLVAMYVVFRHIRYDFMSRRLMIGYVVLLVGMIIVVNYFVPYIWLRGHHHTAEFISVPEADVLLQDEEDVFVLEIGGDARAYPRDWMMIPHIAGDIVGGDEVVMTYCALTNLPQAFSSYIDGDKTNLKVLSQVHNNLVMVDTNSGELYQQITNSSPVSGKVLSPRSGQRMPWRSFKQLYPDGRVFHIEQSGLLGLLDKITYAMFMYSLEDHYTGLDPLFPTLRLDDKRLPDKEQIWGINLSGDRVAYTLSFLEKTPVHNTMIGGQPVVVAWFPKFETLGVFSRHVDGHVIEVSEIDVYGNTPNGKLERLPQYPNVFWMVWSHWFPDTKVMN
jgi:hypothetical protein